MRAKATDLLPIASWLATGADGKETTDVQLDAQIKVKQLPPPPFKGMVKGLSISILMMTILHLHPV